jgi:hypothetical protein
MKKLLPLTLLVLCAAVLVPQNLSAGVGVKAGLNFANLAIKPTSPDMPDFQNLTGTTAGVYFSLGIGPIAIQPEILYSRRGMKYEEAAVGKIEYLNDCIEVPVLVKLSVLPGLVKPFVFAGPSFGYLIKAQGRLTAEGTSITEDTGDMFKKTELAAVFGAGLDFKLAVLKLSVDARYHLGISNIASADLVAEGESIKNKGFSVLVGVGF